MKQVAESWALPRWMRAWEQFWFAPGDPSVLGLIRVACGLITVYTLAVYGFNLQDFMGEHSWHDLELRDQLRHNRPVAGVSWTWMDTKPVPTARTDAERAYLRNYLAKHGMPPPLPFPKDENEAQIVEKFIEKYKMDPRINGAPIPKTEFEEEYAAAYFMRWKGPPPAYPKDIEEAREIAAYMDEYGADPRILIDKGMPIWSLWFHVVDPPTMLVLHWLIVACSFCFMIGFCTRLTTALTWFGSLCYIHRNPTNLFGVDTMMTILLLYLMIGPSGAAFSVDALIRRWWVGAKPRFVTAWRQFWKLPLTDPIAPATPPDLSPSVSANVAIRLMQIHVCIIYLVAGLSKLQGQTWWNGNALWLTLGNYEFAPMHFELYMAFLRFMGRHQWFYDGFMTFGGLFTLAFEIGYAFLIWRPRLRWVFLAAAILLHGFIGLFMGLKTFSLMMLVMNMAFLTKDEALWFLNWFKTPEKGTMRESASVPEPVGAKAD